MQKIGISKKINVIPNGLAKEALLSTTKILNNQTNNRNRKLENDYILSIGRLDRIKNYETVINAMPKINKTISYLIMGPIEDQKYHRELVVNIHKKKLNDRVRFIGVHSGINKYRFLRNATALIHPSKSEGFGNVIYEALSQQTIPVVSSNTATAELIKNKYNGFVIDSSDSLKLAEIINSLINKTNSSEIKKIKHNIKKSFHAQSWSNVAKKLERLYISTFNTKFEITN
jgi:glycosyltransferase involved in cell wall biosynthesis